MSCIHYFVLFVFIGICLFLNGIESKALFKPSFPLRQESFIETTTETRPIETEILSTETTTILPSFETTTTTSISNIKNEDSSSTSSSQALSTDRKSVV